MKRLSLDRTYTDFLKVIAALCVVIGHYASITIVQNWSQSPVWYVIASQAGYIGVALFFSLSGFGLMESEHKRHLDFKGFVKRRFLKIYKPVLLVTVIWVAVEILFMGKELSLEILYVILWGFDDCVLWFIKILMGLYLTFYIFAYLRMKGKPVLSFLVLFVGTIILMIVAHYTEGYSSIGIPCFALGVFASQTKDLKKELMLLILAFSVSVVYSIATHDNHGYHAAFDYFLIGLVLFIPCIVKLPSILESESSFKPIISYMALLTFDVYLVHYKVLDGTVRMGGARLTF